MSTTAPAEPRSALWIGVAVALLAAVVAGRVLLEPGFYDSHDGLLNVHRLFELEKCVADGQLPCRWAPDMGYGFGAPVFNFYPPLGSYVALGLRALGASTLVAVKQSMGLSLVVGALGMLALARSFFGTRGGVVAAVFYTWAPYRAIDIFVRGALAEAWGLALLPWVFFAAERTLRDPKRTWRWGLLCAFCWLALLLAHNITALMAGPTYAIWCLWWLGRAGALPGTAKFAAHSGRVGASRWQPWLPFALAHVLALALALHYVGPSLLEQSDSHTGTLISLYSWAQYANNFLELGQLLLGTAAWGYGPVHTAGGMSLFIGLMHWTIAAAAMLAIAASRGRGDWASADQATLLLALAGAATAAMTISISKPIWDALPTLAFLQFPWRFLAIATFGFAFAAGWWIHLLEGLSGWGRLAAPLCGLSLCLGVVAAGWGWFKPSAMHVVRDEVLANELQIARSRHGLFDFMPVQVDLDRYPKRPPSFRPPPAVALTSDVVLSALRRTSDRVELHAQVSGPGSARIRVNVHRFPGWRASIDGLPVPIVNDADDPLARIHLDVPAGAHDVRIVFENTAIRSASEGISAVAALIALGWAWWAWRRAPSRA